MSSNWLYRKIAGSLKGANHKARWARFAVNAGTILMIILVLWLIRWLSQGG